MWQRRQIIFVIPKQMPSLETFWKKYAIASSWQHNSNFSYGRGGENVWHIPCSTPLYQYLLFNLERKITEMPPDRQTRVYESPSFAR